MAEVVLFHHAQGLTTGVREFADQLRAAGHTVHTPDSYDGQVFDTLDEGIGYAREVGFEAVQQRSLAAAEELPKEVVYAGFSLGVMAAQALTQTRPGASGGLFFYSFVPPAEFGSEWPDGLPAQIHGMDADPFFAADGDLEAARTFVSATPQAELFVYPGSGHLFADSSLSDHDPEAAGLLMQRTLKFLAALP